MSNRRKMRHPAANLDGTHLAGSCCDTEVAVTRDDNLPVLKMLHDDGCAIFSDDPAEQATARIVCNLAVQAALGGNTLSVVVA